MTVYYTANRGRNGNRLITNTEKTISLSVEIILFRKNFKDEVKLQKKYGFIAKIHISQNSTNVFENFMPDAESKELKYNIMISGK